MNELELVARLRRFSPPSKDLILGIGDDCAIFRPRAGEDLLFTTDQMIEGVHFTREQSAASIGERALARSLSDIAAMGGDPRFCLVALAASNPQWIENFYRGLMRLAKKTNTALAGGDLARDEKVRCDVMVCGSAPRGKTLRRDGARVADSIFVSGKLGKPWDRKIQPRLALGRSLRGIATACIDLSDGLSLDLHRLCAASGVAAEIDRVPVMKGSTIDRALHDGEDYELLFTVRDGAKIPRGVSCIGRIVRGKPGEMFFENRALEARGYDHFGKHS